MGKLLCQARFLHSVFQADRQIAGASISVQKPEWASVGPGSLGRDLMQYRWKHLQFIISHLAVPRGSLGNTFFLSGSCHLNEHDLVAPIDVMSSNKCLEAISRTKIACSQKFHFVLPVVNTSND